MPKVSILLTCYNHVRHLPECVEGVTSQTYPDWEIVAVDDGSTDGTREWLESSPVPMKRLFNATNMGTYGSLNRALRESTGEYVAVLNDDDVWLPRKLELQVAAMEADPRLGLSHTSGWFIDGESRKVTDEKPVGFAFPRTGTGDVLASLLEHNRVIASAAVVRRSVFDEVGEWDGAFYGCGDWHMWLRVARKHDVHFADEPLTLYRVHEANACRDVAKMRADSHRIREWVATWKPEEYAGRARMEGATALNWAALGAERAYAGDKPGARRALAESLKVMPCRWQTYARWLTTWLP